MSIGQEKYCYCKGCRFPGTHLTGYHRCGTCKLYGHGQYECSQNNNEIYDKINELFNVNIKYNTKKLPSNLHCTVNDCKIKYTHSTSAHQPIFSKDQFGELSGPDTYGIKRQFNDNDLKGKKLAMNNPGKLIKLWAGMGNWQIYKYENEKLYTDTVDDSVFRT